MLIKKTKTHMVLKLTHKEFDVLRAALDSICDRTEEGAYMDVVKFDAAISTAVGRLSVEENNVWVSSKTKG